MNKWFLFGTILGAVLIVFLYYKLANFHPVDKDDELLRRINELELKIDSLNSRKDSIRSIIDSTHVKIITNEKHYQERINTILIQSAGADSSFITDYIRLYSEQNSLSNSK
jgi:hypothetical protein